MQLRWALLAIYTFVYITVHSQKIAFENIGVRNGLPASEVYNLHQGKRGYLWVFTEYGIVKFNGSSYVPVCTNLALKESAVYAVTESENGNLYIINSKGEVYRIHNDKAYKIKGIEKITSEIISFGMNVCEAFFTDQGDLWISTFSKSYKIPNKKLQFKGMPAETPRKCRNRCGMVWKDFVLGDFSSLKCKILLHSGKTVPFLPTLTLSNSRSMYFELGDRAYFVSFQKITFVDSKGRQKSFDTKVDVIKARVSPNGHIWLCLNTMGVLELDKDLNVVNRYLETQIVSDILFDNQAGVWVSTIGKGIYHCDNVNKKSFTFSNDLADEICLLQEVRGKLFIGTSQGKLFVQDKFGLKQIETPKGMLAPVQVYYHYGAYFVATKSFLGTIRNNKFVYHNPNVNVGTTIFGMVSSDRDNLLILSPGAVDLYNIRKFGVVRRIQYNGKNRNLVEREHGEYYMSTSKGVLLMKGDKCSYPSCLAPLRDKNISSIVVDQFKNVWFSTKGDGVYCLNKKNILVHYVNLPVNIVYSINFTKTGLVLLSTNQGAFAAKMENINNKRLWKLILNEETLCMKEYENNLFVGTKKGLTIIDTKQIFADRKYKFYLASVKGRQGNYLLQKKRTLDYYQNDLYFNYELLDFQKHNNILEYRLSGPTALSGTVAGSQLYLQNLEPGAYTLEVYPKMLFGDSKQLKHQIAFSIHPAFWQTTMFLVLCMLLFVGSVLFVFWMFLRRRNKLRAARAEKERQLVEYRLTALKSQINPHFMSNSLVAIQNLILQSDIDSANLYLAKFSLLLRSLLDYSNKSYASIKSELEMIELYVELEQLRFSNKFEFEVEIGPNVNLHDTFIPTLITQPFIENAIWHGLLPLASHASAKLTFGIHFSNGTLILSIEDNGVGREYHSDSRTQHKSKGTELIASRLETLNQLYGTTGCKIAITDLKDEIGHPIGTLITIELPDSILNELYENKEA